jgi:hypothetical protein
MMHVLLQILQRNFRFFHAATLRSTLPRSRRNWSVEAAGEVDAHVIVIATHGFTGWNQIKIARQALDSGAFAVERAMACRPRRKS